MPEPSMPGRTIAVIAAVAGSALAICLVTAFIHGDFSAEGGRLLELAWGRVLLLDVYAGMLLFACWIAWREPPLPAGTWIALLLLLGNVIACLYLLRAWRSAAGNGQVFWHGRQQRLAMTDFRE